MAIIRNAIQCKKCGDVIESVHVHDFRTCSCGYCSVDGGHDYLRRCAVSLDGYIDLSEVKEDPEELKWPLRRTSKGVNYDQRLNS